MMIPMTLDAREKNANDDGFMMIYPGDFTVRDALNKLMIFGMFTTQYSFGVYNSTGSQRLYWENNGDIKGVIIHLRRVFGNVSHLLARYDLGLITRFGCGK